MPYEFYKILHLAGLIVLISVVSALIYRTWADNNAPIKGKRFLMVLHGIAVVVMLVSGFGLLARLGIMSSWPTWVWIKLAAWFFVIVSPSLVMRVPSSRKFMWWLFPAVLIATAFAVIYKIGV